MTFVCEYCKKTFAKESSIEVHMCEPKRRRLNKDDPGVRLGFQAYIKFYEQAQGSAKLKTYEDFCESSYYLAFVKFGRYCVGAKTINPSQFMNWLLKHQKKIDRWASDQLYTEYLTWYLTIEAVDDALTRAMEYAIDWAEKNGSPSQDCVRYGNANAVCYAITTGRLSAWVIYNSESGQKFLSEANQEQLAMIWPYINVDTWNKKFADYPADQEYAREILTKAGW
jgi:hypothetical protein